MYIKAHDVRNDIVSKRGGEESTKKLYPNNHKRPLTQYKDKYIPQISRPFYMQVLSDFKLPQRSTKLKY